MKYVVSRSKWISRSKRKTYMAVVNWWKQLNLSQRKLINHYANNKRLLPLAPSHSISALRRYRIMNVQKHPGNRRSMRNRYGLQELLVLEITSTLHRINKPDSMKMRAPRIPERLCASSQGLECSCSKYWKVHFRIASTNRTNRLAGWYTQKWNSYCF